jgi:hypothetical protein
MTREKRGVGRNSRREYDYEAEVAAAQLFRLVMLITCFAIT